MNAVIVGSLLMALPVLGFFAWIVAQDGWRMLLELLALYAGCAAATAAIVAGLYLIAEGWPT